MRSIFKFGGGAIVVLIALGFLLGPNFIPFMKTAQKTAAEKILSVVDQHELRLEKAKGSIKQAEEAVYTQAKNRSKLRGLLRRLESNMQDSRDVAAMHRARLVSMRTRLVSDGEVLASSGGKMSNSEIASAVEASKRAIQMAEGRVSSLRMFVNPMQLRLEKMDAACEIAPARIAALRSHVRDLESKITLVRDVQSWKTETDGIVSQEGGYTLDEIEEQLGFIDEETSAEAEALFAVLSLTAEGQPSTPSLSVDELISKVDNAIESSSAHIDEEPLVTAELF